MESSFRSVVGKLLEKKTPITWNAYEPGPLLKIKPLRITVSVTMNINKIFGSDNQYLKN